MRTAWVYEAGGANFVRTMIRLMKEREELGVVSRPDRLAHLGHGLARTIWGLVERKGASGTFITAMRALPAGTISPSPSPKKPMRWACWRAFR
jgi:dTDP-4-dehydrorhamnose reductase